MKMTMKWAALAACVLAMISCQENLQPEVNVPEKGSVSFKATAENPATKTTLNDIYEVLWQNGDKIKVKDGSGNVSQYETANSASATAEFNFVEGSGTAAAGGPYEAWYPATLFDGTSHALPAVQQYVANNISEAPMYATSSDHNLAFKNLCGIIRLKITTDANRSVSKIILSDTSKGLSGAFTIDSNGGVVVSGTDGVTLDCGTSGAAIGTTATNFYIAVPASSYEHLKITVVATDGSVQTRTTKSGKSITVERNKITDIALTFSNLAATKGSADINGDIPQGWVQLWPGGPKWAEFNVGSTISTYAGVTSYTHPDVVGGYYAFKGKYDSQIGSTGGVEGSYGINDTATYVWGSNWRTPTKDEELALINNCTWTYCDGIAVKFAEGCTLAGWKVSGKDDGYTENAIFLPLAGYIDYYASVPSGMGTDGGYYSNYYEETNGFFLNLNSSGQAISSHFPNIGDCVRAVCVNNEEYNYVDLSASGTANCYIVPAAGHYKFKATVKGNGAADLAGIVKDIPYNSAYTASLYWATYGSVLTSFPYKPEDGTLIQGVYYDSDGYIRFYTGYEYPTHNEGNAVIVLKDGSGTILWSWHLWFETDDLESLKQTYPGGAVFMDRNLGATSKNNINLPSGYETSDFGLIYQWGRKDPFFCGGFRADGNNQPSISCYGQNNYYDSEHDRMSVAQSIQQPHVFTQSGDPWMAADQVDKDALWAASKTIFDPCPPGWKVPSKTAWNETFINALKNYSANDAISNSGYSISISAGASAWMPLASFRPGRYIDYYDWQNFAFQATQLRTGSYVGNLYLWAADGALWKVPYGYRGQYSMQYVDYVGVYDLDVDMTPNNKGNMVCRSTMYPVRCVKE